MYEYGILMLPKVESNKVASTNIQRLSIASRLIQGQEKDKASKNLTG